MAAPRDDVRWLVVGLGNPGREYEGTPHNVGFDVVAELERRARAKGVAKFGGLFARGELVGEPVGFLRPLTFMNLSGESVRPATKQLGITTDRLLVVHDEIDLEFGDVRVKVGGGLAGHNGLKSIAELQRTQAFARLRVGVGRPGAGDRRPVRDWILAKWDPVLDVERLVTAAADAVELVLERGPARAMDTVNQR